MPKAKKAAATAAQEAPPPTPAQAARAATFTALDAEMELAAPYKSDAAGSRLHRVKRVPRSKVVEHDRKRRELDEEDAARMAAAVASGEDGDGACDDAEGDADGEKNNNGGARKRKRLRGTKVAFQEDVLNSMPALPGHSETNGVNDDGADDENGEEGDYGEMEESDRYDLLREVGVLEIDLGPDAAEKINEYKEGGSDDEEDDDEGSNEADEDDDIMDGDGVDNADEEDESGTNGGTSARMTVSRGGLVVQKEKGSNKRGGARVVHRLKDFASKRLAQKHGEAIGEHVKGKSESAVLALREVAKVAPGAPQVYSSLGMVFGSMLAEEEEKEKKKSNGERSVDDHLGRLLDLAEKEYASYHVAALLCKRDFVLWEKSGDAASKAANIYSNIIGSPSYGDEDDASIDQVNGETTNKKFDPKDSPRQWNSNRKFWLEHALSAYQASDRLLPPGVDVPCKLARIHMNLGSYIDALTILTDLMKNADVNSIAADGANGGTSRTVVRSEMEGSYPCWLLYADLMVKIGYECKRWNSGTSKLRNQAMRRWLKRESKTFEWQERRMQALCLALEAAAGSESCAELIRWMKERAEKILDKQKNKATLHPAKETTNESPSYEEERQILLTKNKLDLQLFDKRSGEMKLVEGSHMNKKRLAERDVLVEKHRASVRDLAMRRYSMEKESTTHTVVNSGKPPLKPLPLQASRSTVYDIAALLLKQCIELKLFDGGLLVVTSVIIYSKERASRHEKSVEHQKKIELLKNASQGALQPGFEHDQINFESDDSGTEVAVVYISDDEDLEKPELLHFLKAGRLPADITAMHAICLLGAGGNDLMALNYVEQVITSNDLESLANRGLDSNDGDGFESFAYYLHAPINGSFLLASVAGMMTESTKVHPQSNKMLSILRENFLQKVVDNRGNDFDEILKNKPMESMHAVMERKHAVKTLIASLKLLVGSSRIELSLLDVPGKGEIANIIQAVNSSIYVIETAIRFQYALWSPTFSDWSLPQSSMDMLSILAGAITILVQAISLVNDKQVYERVYVGLQKSQHLISAICQANFTVSNNSTSSLSAETWRAFPLPSSWQTNYHEKLSLRAYNLCVSSCVSSFSGWEPSEFNLDQMMRHSDINFFGVTIEGPYVAGFLPDYASSSISDQWKYISDILPELELLQYEKYLDERKKMSWYQKVMQNMKSQGIDTSKISIYGESDGMKALLSFSNLCLMMAKESEQKDSLLKTAFSIILPVTQFSIDRQVWQSNLGTKATTPRNESQLGYHLDSENSNWFGPLKANQEQIALSINNVRIPHPKRPTLPRRMQSKSTNVCNIVNVPTSVLLREWNKVDVVAGKGKGEAQIGQRKMKELDSTMKNLRKSRTLASLEQACIDVAVALASLVDYEECENPFVCMQQAACYAGMGCKRGNSNEPFKRILPDEKRCTPVEALSILCTADCLRAVHFLQEAQFFCSYVASVCQSHRDKLEDDMCWNSRWLVVGVLTYIISANIEETGDTLAEDDLKLESLLKWEQSTKDEIARGKHDAQILASINTVPDLGENSNGAYEERSHERDDDDGLDSMRPLGENPIDKNGLDIHQFLNDELQHKPNQGDDDPYAGIQVIGV